MRCSVYCPPLQSPYATSLGTCTGSTISDTANCVQACNAGYSRVTGGSTFTVRGRRWSCGVSDPVVINQDAVLVRFGAVAVCCCAVYVADVQCNVGQWSAAPVVCEPLCETLTAPPNVASCSKVLLVEPFDDNSTLARWQIAPQIPASIAPLFWNISNGTTGTRSGRHRSSSRRSQRTNPWVVVVAA